MRADASRPENPFCSDAGGRGDAYGQAVREWPCFVERHRLYFKAIMFQVLTALPRPSIDVRPDWLSDFTRLMGVTRGLRFAFQRKGGYPFPLDPGRIAKPSRASLSP